MAMRHLLTQQHTGLRCLNLSRLLSRAAWDMEKSGIMKAKATATIDGSRHELHQLSNDIWHHPELGYHEHMAHDLLTAFLEKKGFTVDRSYTGIETAFRATFGSGRPNVCVICEYDALPEIGHACGHNLIAEAGVAAGLGLKAALECSAAPEARVTVLGTPAEEGGGGKIRLIRNGAFADIDASMMVHPASDTIVAPTFCVYTGMHVTYTGKAAHAAAFPWEGVNALDAAVTAYTSISALRQQLHPMWRVHGIISNGGVKPNIIPKTTDLKYSLRTPTVAESVILQRKVAACFKAAALATGCEFKIGFSELCYANVYSNPTLIRLYADNLAQLGVKYQLTDHLMSAASTDMGNVSHIVPSIHPLFAIHTDEMNHHPGFAKAANAPDAHRQALLAAKAMAHTGIDVLCNKQVLDELQQSLAASPYLNSIEQ